ncbi:MAG: hypothetical protein ACTSRU_01815 [Candidatus Hodarchaeales archaeon]
MGRKKRIYPMRKDSRNISGQRYTLSGSAKPITSKKDASKIAEGFRVMGYPSRVLPCQNGFRVFTKHSGRKRKSITINGKRIKL